MLIFAAAGRNWSAMGQVCVGLSACVAWLEAPLGVAIDPPSLVRSRCGKLGSVFIFGVSLDLSWSCGDLLDGTNSGRVDLVGDLARFQ